MTPQPLSDVCRTAVGRWRLRRASSSRYGPWASCASSRSSTCTFAAILLACAAAAMMWIKETPIVRDVDDVLAMPMGRGH
jgi:hypothetical protein